VQWQDLIGPSRLFLDEMVQLNLTKQ